MTRWWEKDLPRGISLYVIYLPALPVVFALAVYFSIVGKWQEAVVMWAGTVLMLLLGAYWWRKWQRPG